MPRLVRGKCHEMRSYVGLTGPGGGYDRAAN